METHGRSGLGEEVAEIGNANSGNPLRTHSLRGHAGCPILPGKKRGRQGLPVLAGPVPRARCSGPGSVPDGATLGRALVLVEPIGLSES